MTALIFDCDGVLADTERDGVARVVEEAHTAGWQPAVCSTSAEASVRAILENAVGTDRAAEFLVLAGDVVPAKKPAPDIYLLVAPTDSTLERRTPGDYIPPSRSGRGRDTGYRDGRSHLRPSCAHRRYRWALSRRRRDRAGP